VIVLRGCLLAGILGLAAMTAAAQESLPALEVESLSGQTVKLPVDLPPSPNLLIIGFSRDARDQTEPWARRMTATRGRAASVSVRQVVVLDAPRLLQGFIVDRIRDSVPQAMHSRFWVERDDVDGWKQLAGYDEEDAAYLLLFDAQHRLIWRSVGGWSRETERDLLKQLAALRATTPQALNIARIDKHARELMQREQVNGLALAVIDDGRVTYVASYGQRDVEQSLPLTPDTVMYGASLTKTAFAYMVLQLVDEQRLDLDASIADLLPKPLPEYEGYADLAGDERWRALTPRILLSHGSGFANFRWLEDDGKLRFHHDPGSRYGYSGEGFYILQLVLEEGLGLDVGAEMQARIFDRFGMKRSSMQWREDFADNLADGYALDGSMEPHDARSRVSAAGSMDTTIADQARMWAAIVRGDGLSEAARAELVRPQLAITSPHQFPTLDPEVDARNDAIGLAAGLGLVVFKDDSGPAFFKGGHNDWTGNIVVCLEAKRRCAVLLSNDVRAERLYPELVAEILGGTRMPWRWEYGWIENDADDPDAADPPED
jgi:CubicO group peptidase (beta-lactamase class C family)